MFLFFRKNKSTRNNSGWDFSRVSLPEEQAVAPPSPSLVLGLALFFCSFSLLLLLYSSPTLSLVVSSKSTFQVQFQFQVVWSCSGADPPLRLMAWFPCTYRWIESMQDRGRDPTGPNFCPPCLLRKVFVFLLPISRALCFLNPCFRWKWYSMYCCEAREEGGIEKWEVLRCFLCVLVFFFFFFFGSFLGNQTKDIEFYRR